MCHYKEHFIRLYRVITVLPSSQSRKLSLFADTTQWTAGESQGNTKNHKPELVTVAIMHLPPEEEICQPALCHHNLVLKWISCFILVGSKRLFVFLHQSFLSLLTV